MNTIEVGSKLHGNDRENAVPYKAQASKGIPYSSAFRDAKILGVSEAFCFRDSKSETDEFSL